MAAFEAFWLLQYALLVVPPAQGQQAFNNLAQLGAPRGLGERQKSQATVLSSLLLRQLLHLLRVTDQPV